VHNFLKMMLSLRSIQDFPKYGNPLPSYFLTFPGVVFTCSWTFSTMATKSCSVLYACSFVMATVKNAEFDIMCAICLFYFNNFLHQSYTSCISVSGNDWTVFQYLQGSRYNIQLP
jgi:hypothetical protein